MLDGEALVFDAGDEVAILELFFDCFDRFFFLCTADCGADCEGYAVGFTVGSGGGMEEKWVVEMGFQGYCGGSRWWEFGGREGEKGCFHFSMDWGRRWRC